MELEENGRPNKSALKRAAKEVETVAQLAAEQVDALLARLELSDRVREEILLASSTQGHGSRKRQIKHLAGLLRKSPDDLAEIQAFLAGTSEQQLAEQAQFHQLEQWRDALCDPETAAVTLDEIVSRYPEVNRDELEKLSRSAQQRDKKAYREIFRRLRKVIEAQG
jgi:ribosome-associated protein